MYAIDEMTGKDKKEAGFLCWKGKDLPIVMEKIAHDISQNTCFDNAPYRR